MCKTVTIYREMTPEEKLEYNREILDALITNSFIGADIVHEKWKLRLLNKSNIEDRMEETFGSEILASHERRMQEHTEGEQAITGKKASIYAKEHLKAVIEDLNGNNGQIDTKPKTRVLGQGEQHIAPNIWADAMTVKPGQM